MGSKEPVAPRIQSSRIKQLEEAGRICIRGQVDGTGDHGKGFWKRFYGGRIAHETILKVQFHRVGE
jgi:hypothetical protein